MSYGNNFSECGAIFPVRLHRHALVELVVTFRGAHGEISVEDMDGSQHQLPINEYQCCLLPAGVCHAVGMENRHRYVSLFIDAGPFAESDLDCISSAVIEDLRKLTWRDPFVNQLVSELDGKETIYSNSVLTRSMLTTLAVRIVDGFIGIYRDCGTATQRGFTEIEKKRAHAFIEAHLDQKFCMASLAKHMATSLPNLNRRFRATFGAPPLQYALRLRVDKALDLLRTGNARVADAAFSVGFCDQSHFDRHCRKFYGYPPGAFIRATL